MVLVDSSIIIDFINRNKNREVIGELLEGKKFSTNEIIIMEVLQDIGDESKYKKIRSFLESLPLIEIKYGDYITAAEIYRTCRKNGITIRKSIDCIIAAVVINNDLELFSNDSDFELIRKYFPLNNFKG